MKNVRPKRLGDLLTLKRGYDLPEAKRNEGSYPVISSAGISGYHSEYKVEGEGVVIGRYGTLGDAHYIEGRYWPHNTSLYVTDFKGNCPRYIYYLLTCIGRIKTSDKSAVPGVNRNELHEMAVPAIEDVCLQRKVASVLATLDAKIALNKRIIEELQALAKLVYDYWFLQFDFPITAAQAAAMRKPHLKGRPYRASGGKLTYNEVLKREIPLGWVDGSLLDVAEFTNGIACQKYPADGGETLRVIKIKEMRTGFTADSDIVTKRVPAKVRIKNGDLLFSWSASLEVMIWTGGDGALNQHIFKVTPDSHPRSFCYFVLLDYLQHFRMIADLRKTTMGHITIDHLQQSQIVIPDDDVTEAFEVTTKPIIERMMKAHEENMELTKLRDWLLPMLMNGQITVGCIKDDKNNKWGHDELPRGLTAPQLGAR